VYGKISKNAHIIGIPTSYVLVVKAVSKGELLPGWTLFKGYVLAKSQRDPLKPPWA